MSDLKSVELILCAEGEEVEIDQINDSPFKNYTD